MLIVSLKQNTMMVRCPFDDYTHITQEYRFGGARSGACRKYYDLRESVNLEKEDLLLLLLLQD